MGEGKMIVECYGDGLLIKQMRYQYLEGHSGIGQVANRMTDSFKNQFALAIIDNDKSLGPKYFNKDNITAINKSKGKVQLYKCAGKHHFVIKISPAFEDFILTAANEAGHDRRNFKLPANEAEFRKLCKSKDLHKNQKMVNFVNAIVSKNPPAIQALRSAITEATKKMPR